MPVRKNTVKEFKSGIHNRLDDENIPNDAAQRSIGWLTKDGRIELMYGRQFVGAEGAAGKNYGEHAGFKPNGEEIRFRKIWDGTEGKIQYLDDSNTWQDTVAGLSEGDVTFTNYSTLAGNFVYVTSPQDGLYKIVTANPGDAAALYDADKNFKGYMFIDKGRSIMWNTENDATGLYGSYIDAQDSSVYTTISGENLGSSGNTNYTGTLAFKSGGSTRTCFGVSVTDGVEIFTDKFDGTLEGDQGGTGVINYMTGDFDITFNAATVGAVLADYQHEDSNNKGVTDFSKSSTRQAGEGFVVRQDGGGDAIQVVLPFEGSYFSFKESSVYQFTLDAEDTNPTNELIRSDIGVSSLRAATPTSRGLVFMDTGNPTEPTLTILQRNINGDNFTNVELFPQFDFSLYKYDDIAMETWDEYVVVACAEDTAENDRMLMCNVRKETVDVAPYAARTFVKSGGFLNCGDPVSQSTYELFTGFDDVGTTVVNRWDGAADLMGDDVLKRVKRMRLKGIISRDQEVEVYIAVEGGAYELVGTILGSGDYVNYNSTFAIGTTFLGQDTVGGGDTETTYRFLMEIKCRYGKFRKRSVRFVAKNLGYVAMEMIQDFDIWAYQEKLPVGNRLKQNVSLDGENTDLATPA